jgi:hypothetical protein
MGNQSLLVAATALLVSCGVACAQNQPSQDKTSAPPGFPNSTPNKPVVATVPEAATDTPGGAHPANNRTSSQCIKENGC